MQITRVESGAKESSLANGGGLRGVNGTVRNNNLCLQAGSGSATSNSTCPSGIQVNGKKLAFASCNGVQPLEFAPSRQICPSGKTSFDVCCDSTGPDCPGGVVTGNAARIIPCCKNAPPQILVEGSAIYYGGAGSLVLTTASTDDSSCEGKSYVARNINTATYAQSLVYPPCITGMSYCQAL